MHQTNQIKLKITILGDTASGKTCLLRRFLNHTYHPSYQPTFAADLSSFKKQDTLIQIWDVSGMECFRVINSIYYCEADIIILVYDINIEDSYETIKSYLQQISQQNYGSKTITIAANKADNKDTITEDGLQRMLQLAQEYSAIHRFMSAKTGFNVQQFFNEIIEIGMSKGINTVTTETDTEQETSFSSYWQAACSTMTQIGRLYTSPVIQELSIGLLYFLDII